MLVNEKGNIHDVNILDVTAENYIVPDGEEHLYHCRIEQREFNRETGARISVPRIQKFYKKQFETQLLHNLKRIGYTVDILHNPTEWIEAHKEAEAKEKKEREERKKAAEEAAIQARIDAAVAKALAEREGSAEQPTQPKRTSNSRKR